jgi:hypothetical protein
MRTIILICYSRTSFTLVKAKICSADETLLISIIKGQIGSLSKRKHYDINSCRCLRYETSILRRQCM